METAVQTELRRSAIYKLLSGAFLYPDEDFLFTARDISEDDSGPPEGDDLEIIHEGLSAICATLQNRSLEELRLEHQRVFGHTISKEHPPYETEYGDMNVYQQAQEMGDVAGFYRAFGLELSEDAKDRVDHIGIQLEFMHFLTYKEAYASQHHAPEETEICRDAQKKFIEEHVGKWVPEFCRLLKEKAGESFLGRLATVTSDFISFENSYLGIDPREIKDYKPWDSEEQGDDFSCG